MDTARAFGDNLHEGSSAGRPSEQDLVNIRSRKKFGIIESSDGDVVQASASRKRCYNYVAKPEETGIPTFDNPSAMVKRRKGSGSLSTPMNQNGSLLEESSAARHVTSNLVRTIMENMAFIRDKGLGKKNHDITEPNQASLHKVRRDLGHSNQALIKAIGKWDPSQEIISVREKIYWLRNDQEPPIAEDFRGWMRRAPWKKTIDDETLFCEPQILHQVISSKSIFDGLEKREIQRARIHSNPFEAIRDVFFLNQDAVKMANIDRACNFMFTNPTTANPHEILYFADVCAGPGGFSEYVLWRRKWHAKGFGFTLRGSNDFQLHKFYAGPPETFHPFYGPKGDGNIYDPENQLAYQQLIMNHTQGQGVHFMMADGGFSVEGSESIQEILSKQLYLCQCLIALKIVRTGGHFVTKFFDLFTPFSVGLIYLLYRCFEKISIFKPNTSRPGNSERYLICEKKKSEIEAVINYLSYATEVLLRGDGNGDIRELVPVELLQDADSFYNYICSSNNVLGRKQVMGLLKIAAFAENRHLSEPKQTQMRKECLEYWNLPDQTRIVPKHVKPEERLRSIVGESIVKSLSAPPMILTCKNVTTTILENPCDWYAVLCGSDTSGTTPSKQLTFYLGMGRTKVFRLVKNTWERVDNIELPPNTLVYAELVEELRGLENNIRRTEALHIVDAYLLGGEDISRNSLPERYALINKFCEALWKANNSAYCPVRAKELHPLDRDLPMKLHVQPCTLINKKKILVHYLQESFPRRTRPDNDPLSFVPNSVVFLKTTSAPWRRVISKKTSHHYYFNSMTNENFYANRRPESACASFLETFVTRLQLHWPGDSSLSINYIYDNVKQKCPVLLPQD
ncbi:cap-specific mRNA (nucleoside-2'-O-)-methyltransferase 1-like isoform X2 [Diachasmimorpha longicaudata]|uniref:cap-specific mRNA (nucleoside-2'-O-)-methyltransferase 1-like isoform X2 n=1 Tax=Diachasmimorpha longicaudata TaxID=58733 RepID=UPI0030B90D10